MAPASDPSTFEKHPELPGQASTAALYVTHPERVTNVRELHPSEADQKLSSAGMLSLFSVSNDMMSHSRLISIQVHQRLSNMQRSKTSLVTQ